MTLTTTVLPRTSTLVANDLCRQFGEGDVAVDALIRVNLTFEQGKFSAIMGPSGSGKSTLLHLLAGLDQPTSGSVTIAGTEISTLSDNDLAQIRREQIGFVFQSFNLLPVLTAKANILLPLTVAGKSVDEQWFQELVDKVGLNDRLDHRPSELSGGQQQRVAVARALITKPAVIFADEPTGNLDSKASTEVLTLLRNCVDDFHQTIVMVTHEPSAATYADRLVVLADGRVVHDGVAGKAEEILDLMKTFG